MPTSPSPADQQLPAGLRRVTNTDADALIAIVGAAFDEYPGCVLDLADLDADLVNPATTAGRSGTAWWVVERAGEVVATVSAGSLDDEGQVELKRLYLAAAARGRGLATALVQLVESHAAGLGARRVTLWSDTRFAPAHHRYETLGYTRTGETRDLHDVSETTEYRFVKEITPQTVARTVTWDGPFGRDVATLVPLPDGWLLTSSVAGGEVASRVEVDALWRTRTAEVRTAGSVRRVTSDAAGAWWADGEVVHQLDGCVDVDVEVTPLTNTLPIRRLLAADVPVDEPHDVAAAWIRVPGLAVDPLHQTYVHLGDGRWTYRAGDFTAELTVDADGLVTVYGDRWRPVDPA